MLVRGIENGKPVKKIVEYKPYLFIPTKNESKYKTLAGETVGRMDFDSVTDARDFVKHYDDVSGMPIYGMTNYLYTFIFDTFRGEIKYDPSLISVCSLDIETKVGEEDIATAIQTTPNEITAITISRNGLKSVFGCGDFKTDDKNITYYRCKDEKTLLNVFLEIWNSSDYRPDVVTGWNIEFFDIPYLVGRITKLLGEEAAKKLSPWGQIRPYDVEVKGKRVTSYEIKGVSVLDYLALYKKFTYVTRES
jgi:DNA polymerase elongation subunit (family B)